LKLEPLNERIVVGRLESDKHTSGAHGVKLVLPDGVQKQSQKARVIATWEPYTDCEGTMRKPNVEEGDVVFIPRYSGEEFELAKGNKVLFIAEADLLGVIRAQPDDASEEGEANAVGKRAAS
jgi:co-chaperonin GroES (HSP10)